MNFRRLMWLPTWLALLLTFASWALASPVGSAADEDFHLVSIYCAGSPSADECQLSHLPTARIVNSSLLDAPCYVLDPQTSALCQETEAVFTDTMPIRTSRGNFQGTYPDVFYLTMSFFVSTDVQLSVVSMRLFNATLFTAMTAMIFFLVPNQIRKSLLLSVSLTVVPLGLFFIPSINPTTWVITGTFAAFFGQIGAGLVAGWRQSLLVTLSMAGFVLAASSRFDGIAYGALAIFTALALTRFRVFERRTVLTHGQRNRPVLLLSFGALASTALIVLVLSGEKLITLRGDDADFFKTFLTNVARMPLFLSSFHGSMGLGWLETSMPYATWMVASLLFWASVFSRLRFMQGRQLLMVLLVAASSLLLPLAALQWTGSVVGQAVQARYFFPLMIILISTALYTSREQTPLFSATQLSVIGFGLFVAQSAAIFTTLSRYISGVGLQDSTWNLNQASESGWWWGAGPSPMSVFFVAVICFGLFLAGSSSGWRFLSPNKQQSQTIT